VSKYFVVAHVRVDEHQGSKFSDNPGAKELEKRLGGPAGLPFFAFLKPDGELIVNSMEPPAGGRKGGNIGHPAEPHEIDWFLEMLKKAAPKMTPEERAEIDKPLRPTSK
jgi:hypothetical protein